ncbi:MAG: arylsulfatase [Acidobacteria bacterium]|nr:arylsulfatase [Acidobacteriota bacterium]
MQPNRRVFISQFAAGSMALAQAPHPNVVLIMADDLGARDAAFMGGNIPTPNLDRIANEGARFTQFCCFPLCTPSRSALMTGRNPVRYGLIYSVIRPWSPYGVPARERMLSEVFHDAGYQTAIIGKWHLGHAHKSQLPNARGFDHFYGHLNAEIDYYEHTEMGGLDWQRNGRGLRESGYSTNLLGAEAVQWLTRRDRDRPFFLYLPFNAVHAPMQAPPEAIARFNHLPNLRRRTLAAMLDVMDKQVGRVLDTLDSQGLASNTIVLFLSDNGGAPGQGADNLPFRAGKLTCYEGGLRVPAAIRYPGRVTPGSVIPDWMTVLDVFPTLCSAAGLKPQLTQPLDGVDMWPVITGKGSATHENFFVACKKNETADYQYGLRTAEWKLVQTIDPQLKTTNELFHLEDDPREQNNVAAQNPDVLARLAVALENWKKLHPKAGIDSSMTPHPGWSPPADFATLAADYPMRKTTP